MSTVATILGLYLLIGVWLAAVAIFKLGGKPASSTRGGAVVDHLAVILLWPLCLIHVIRG